MTQDKTSSFTLTSLAFPIRLLRPLWGVLSDLEHFEIRDKLFEKHNLNKSRLMSDEKIPIETILQIFAYCENHAISEAGFLTGISSEYGQFGIFDYYLSSVANIGDMVKSLEYYFPILTTEKPLLKITQPIKESFQLSLPKSISSGNGSKLFNEMLLGIVVRTMNVNSGKASVLPTKISFPYINLPKSIVLFLTDKKIKVQLDKKEYQLLYSTDILPLELQYRDNQIVKLLKPTLDNLLLKSQQEKSTSVRIVEIFSQSSDLSRLSLISVAEELGLSQSGLKRKLADEDSSFSFLLARYKQSRSMEMVTSSDLTLSESGVWVFADIFQLLPIFSYS